MTGTAQRPLLIALVVGLGVRYVAAGVYLAHRPAMSVPERLWCWVVLTPLELLFCTGLLMPVKLLALTKLRDAGWGTRQMRVPAGVAG